MNAYPFEDTSKGTALNKIDILFIFEITAFE